MIFSKAIRSGCAVVCTLALTVSGGSAVFAAAADSLLFSIPAESTEAEAIEDIEIEVTEGTEVDVVPVMNLSVQDAASELAEEAEAEANAPTEADIKGLTAGVTTVVTKSITPTVVLTAGVAAPMTDYDSGEVYIVQQEKIKVAEALAAEEAAAKKKAKEEKEAAEAAEKAARIASWGYENLGIAETENTLNVRASGSLNAEIVGRMANHAACEVLETSDSWIKIQSGDVTGYVAANHLLVGDEAYEVALEEVQTIATVTSSTNLHVRKSASTDSTILTNVRPGEELTVLGEPQDGWVYIQIDNTLGYVSTDYVEIAESLTTAQEYVSVVSVSKETYNFSLGDDAENLSETRVELVETALQYVGNPYVYGGSSLTNGTDCSGFTMSIYKKFGISLPHHAASQPAYGKTISASEAQPGDLIFYGDGTSINHVAIYIGNGKVVHASTERTGIKISNANYRDPICVVSYLD